MPLLDVSTTPQGSLRQGRKVAALCSRLTPIQPWLDSPSLPPQLLEGDVGFDSRRQKESLMTWIVFSISCLTLSRWL